MPKLRAANPVIDMLLIVILVFLLNLPKFVARAVMCRRPSKFTCNSPVPEYVCQNYGQLHLCKWKNCYIYTLHCSIIHKRC
jgi:hypothetical protein